MSEQLLAEAFVFPCQLSTGKSYTPEQKLCYGILAEAVTSIQSDDDLIADETRVWFESRKKNYVFSFESICLILDLDASAIRARVLKPTSQKVRYDDQGNVLPRGVYLVKRGRGSRYQVTTYSNITVKNKFFATLKEAVRYRLAYEEERLAS